jgi:hypothetical protein
MIEKDELKLKLSRFRDFWRMGYDFHSIFSRREASRQKLRFSFLLDNAEAARAKWDEPPVMAERGDHDPDRLSGLKDRLAPLNFNLNAIDREFHLNCHSAFGTMEYWSTGALVKSYRFIYRCVAPSFHDSNTPKFLFYCIKLTGLDA